MTTYIYQQTYKAIMFLKKLSLYSFYFLLRPAQITVALNTAPMEQKGVENLLIL